MNTLSSSPQVVEFSGVGGITLVADEWNRDAETAGHPAILMLHGGGQNRFSWKNTGQILADEGYHVVALDSRGHGDSDRAPGADYAIETLTADVLHILEAIGRPVVLIGASMGGLTGILVADSAGPAKVTGLVLVDVVPRYEKNGSARIRDFMLTNLHGFGTLEEAADAVAAYLPYREKPRSPEGLKKNLRLRDGRWYWHWDPAFMTAPGADPELRTEHFEQAAADLKVPVLLIRGKLSDVVSPEGVRHFLATVPRAEFVELSNAGHTAAGDDNDAFSDAVVTFVRRLTGFSAWISRPLLVSPRVDIRQAANRLVGLDQPRPSDYSACPPNYLRMADSALLAKSSRLREAKRDCSAVVRTGAGTPSSIAAMAVHRPSPESETRPENSFRSGDWCSAIAVRSNNQEPMTLPRRHTSATSGISILYW